MQLGSISSPDPHIIDSSICSQLFLQLWICICMEGYLQLNSQLITGMGKGVNSSFINF